MRMNWSYVAAFFEGEGSICCYFNYQHKLRVDIHQKDKRILNKIKKFINFKAKLQLHKQSQVWRLSFGCAKARWFANKILPYCNHPGKIKQIKTALRLDKKFVKPRKIKRNKN